MIISMYQASVPRFVNILGNLSNILDKAQVHVDAKKLDAATFVATGSDRVAIPAISQWRSARKARLTAPPGPKIRPGRAIEFPILSEYAG
jgi:hypothetical protein